MATKARYKIYEELAKVKVNYDTSIMLIDSLPFKQRDVIKMVEHYTNSKYINGQKDELGRDKAFYNVLNGIVDVENAAKDLDRSDIKIESIDGNHYLQSFLLGKDLAVWMNEVTFGKTLNDMKDIHSRYGSLLVKKCFYTDENGKKQLRIESPAWKNVQNDQVDILKSPIVETQWMLPSEMLAKKEWENQGEAIKLAMKDPKNKYRVPVFELRGEFPRGFYKEMTQENYSVQTDDYSDYSYQLYYLSGEIGAKLICLYAEDDTERVYKYLARKKKPGRSFGVGVCEEGEEAQVWINDAVLKQSRAMEYSSKVVGQSATKNLKGRNILTEVDDGTILQHEEGKPITALPLLPPGGLNQYSALISQWYDQFEKTSSAYAAQRGETPPSHTPYRLQALTLQQSHSVFDQLRQEMGIFIEEIFNDWVLPFLAKQLTPEHILAGEFSSEELKEIDRNFAINEANQMAKEAILSGKLLTQEEYDSFIDFKKQVIGKTKNRRFLQIPKNFYKDLKSKIVVDPTGEQKNKAAILESVSNIMMIYMKNPMATQDPVLSLLFKQIIEFSGIPISPVDFQAAIEEQARKMKSAQPAPAVAGGQGGSVPGGGLENAMVPSGAPAGLGGVNG